MQRRWALAAALVAALCAPAVGRAQERAPAAVSTGTPGSTAAPSDEVARRARDLLADERYQKSRPGALPSPPRSTRTAGSPPSGPAKDGPGGAGPPDPLADAPPAAGGKGPGGPAQGFGDEPGSGSGEPRRVRPPGAPGSGESNLFGLIVLSLLGVVLLVLLALGVTSIFRGRTRVEEAAPAAEQDPSLDAERVLPLGEVEALAMAGEYAEAIHALFHRAVRRLAARGSLAIADEMTGREVLRAAAIEDGARAALGDLVLAVEVSVFGGRPLERADYDRCVASYQRLGLGS